MRVEREEAKVENQAKCKHGGASAGDTIIFSNHNLANKNLPVYLSYNKPYVVEEVNKFGDSWWFDDEGDESSWIGGSYDIIIRAEQKPVDPVFQPVHVVLESEEEVEVMKSLMGCSAKELSYEVYDALSQL